MLYCTVVCYTMNLLPPLSYCTTVLKDTFTHLSMPFENRGGSCGRQNQNEKGGGAVWFSTVWGERGGAVVLGSRREDAATGELVTGGVWLLITSPLCDNSAVTGPRVGRRAGGLAWWTEPIDTEPHRAPALSDGPCRILPVSYVLPLARGNDPTLSFLSFRV